MHRATVDQRLRRVHAIGLGKFPGFQLNQSCFGEQGLSQFLYLIIQHLVNVTSFF